MTIKFGIMTIALLGFSAALHGQDGNSVIISRGEARLTLDDMDARMSRMPKSDRPVYAHKPANLAGLMDQTLLNRQLAIEARAAGIDQRADVKRDLELAIEEVLAVHRLNALVDDAPRPDFEQLARERYQADKSGSALPAERIVEHVLIKTEGRSEEEALKTALDVRGKALVEGADFSALVDTYSDDSGKGENAGRYTLSRPGQYVPEFEAAAMALSTPGDISEPVKTKFGYHVIRLVEARPARSRPFDEVKGELIAKAMAGYEESIRDSHKRKLRSESESGNEELLVSLRQRYGGEPDSPPAAQSN